MKKNRQKRRKNLPVAAAPHSEHPHLGKHLYSWIAHNYHPYQRGVWWYVGFVGFVVLCMWGIIKLDPEWGWVSAIAFCVVGVIYLLSHKDGVEPHQVDIYEKALVVDGKHHFHWEKMEGFWIHEDIAVRQVVFDGFKYSWGKRRIQILLGDTPKHHVRKALKKAGVPELEGREEYLVDLWSRVLKL